MGQGLVTLGPFPSHRAFPSLPGFLLLPPTLAKGTEPELSHGLERQHEGPALKQRPVQGGKRSAAAQQVGTEDVGVDHHDR